MSPELSEFFENSPCCTSRGPRIRVAQGIVAWIWHMGEIAAEKQEIESYEYKKNAQAKEKQEAEKWAHEKARFTKWVFEYMPSFGHEEIHNDFARMKAEKRKADQIEASEGQGDEMRD